MHDHDTVLNLAAIAVVLPHHADCVAATFVHSGFVDEPDGFRVSMIVHDDFLTVVSQSLLIPLDGFQPLKQYNTGCRVRGATSNSRAIASQFLRSRSDNCPWT